MTIQDQYLELGDAALLARARGGDPGALSCLVSRHQGVVYRFLLSFLKDEDQAADTAQNTFLKVLGRLDGFRGDSSFRTWLLAIARNEALGLLRSQARRKEEALEQTEFVPDYGDAPDDVMVRMEEVRRVRVALERLPKKQRLSVSLRLFDELSFREIGKIIGSTEGAVRANYHHGIGRLRKWLDEHGE